jgi:hypothetical protein
MHSTTTNVESHKFHLVLDPGQVARTLEATVLHNFAVSNRPGIFVYKDETEAIFYMTIEPRGTGIDADGRVELLVYGVSKPGPSVTEQLRVLLQRRLLLIAVDMLSSVLTKNPHFKWKQADIKFLRSFEQEWKKLEEDKEDAIDVCRYYEFPSAVTDPCMVLLSFRQNLCGSTFFHRLNDIDQNGSNPSPPITLSCELPSGGVSLQMNKHEFSLYYNNAPSKLEPSFQAVNTLTSKGAEYCRQTGQGISMIEFTLMKCNGEFIDSVDFAKPVTASHSGLDVPLDNLRMKRLVTFPNESQSVCARIKITDTALNRRALHEWLHLTLNQALVAWVTERLIESSFNGLLMPVKLQPWGAVKTPDVDKKRQIEIDFLCPGLPSFRSILESSIDLPHSAFTRYDSSGVTRSSSVATLTLGLLEKCVLAPLLDRKHLNPSDDGTKCTAIERLRTDVQIIRISRAEKPCIAHLKWNDSDRRKAVVSVVSDDGSFRNVEDSPIECPEYICFFSVSERNSRVESIDNQLRLFREVVVHDGISEKSASIDLLESIKHKCKRAFLRSFAFVFSVKRNTRCLMTYNWNPKTVKRYVTPFF